MNLKEKNQAMMLFIALLTISSLASCIREDGLSVDGQPGVLPPEQGSPEYFPPGEQAGLLLFRSGFEEGVFVTNDMEDIRGSDGMDWVADLEESIPQVRRFSINFVGGRPDRNGRVQIRQDPENPSNRALFFENINSPENGTTTRVQNEMLFREYNDIFEQGLVRYRMYFPEHMEKLKDYPDRIHWFTIQEWWENRDDRLSGDRAGKSRVTLSINKDQGRGKPLYWRLKSEKRQPNKDRGKENYREFNRDVEIPIGEWFTLEVFFRAGDRDDGLVQVAIIRESGDRYVVFNKRGNTQHPSSPQPIRTWQFFKLYTSVEIIDFMRNQGDPLAVYYDDLEIRTGGFRGQ